MTTIKILSECKVFAAIVGIVIVEMYALSQGINGHILALTIAAISGLGGYELASINERKQRTKT